LLIALNVKGFGLNRFNGIYLFTILVLMTKLFGLTTASTANRSAKK